MMMMMIAQLEQALKKVGDKVFHTQQELHFMASDNRQQQRTLQADVGHHWDASWGGSRLRCMPFCSPTDHT